MKYEDFKNDFDNITYYYDINKLLCYDQMFYNFNKKYSQLNNDLWNIYMNQYKYEKYKSKNWIMIMTNLVKLKEKNN